MPRTDGIGAAPSPGGNGNGKRFANRPPQPALGNDGGKGISTSTHTGHLLLPMPTDQRFTPLEAKFITEYLKDPTAPPYEIAILAGYSQKTAKQQAAIILRRPKILAEIGDQMHAFVQRERLSIQRLVRHLIELAEVDKRDYYNEDGSLKNPHELTKPQAALIKSMTIQEIWDIPGSPKKVQTGELKKITLTDQLEPIKMLAKSLQGFVDRMEVKSQAMSYHKHEHTIRAEKGEIDFTVLPVDDLLMLKGLHNKVRELTRAKLANSRSVKEGRA